MLRGFNVSPRLAIALLFEFIFRWNVNIDIDVCGLPESYRVYELQRFEEEQEATRFWNLSPPMYHELVPTRDFADTQEYFGLVVERRSNIEEDRDTQDAAALELEMDSDAIMPLHEKVLSHLPAGSRWMAEQLNVSRPYRGVKTVDECKFFRSNYLKFQVARVGRDADGYSFINWSAFETFWNNRVAAEDRGKFRRTDMTYKTSGLLAKYFKEFSRNNNSRSTLEAHHDGHKRLRESLRSPARALSVDHPAARPIVSQAARELPTAPAAALQPSARVAESSSQTETVTPAAGPPPPVSSRSHRVLVPPFSGSSIAGSAANPTGPPMPTKRTQDRVKRNGRRCRMCGHESESAVWIAYHVAPQGLPNIVSQRPQPYALCTVPEQRRVEGFPQMEGVLPRVRKRKARLVDAECG